MTFNTISTLNSGPAIIAPRVPAFLNQHAAAITLYTAASENYVARNYVPNSATILPASPRILQGDGKTPLTVLGNINLMLTLANWREPTSVWVVDTLAEGIILAWS